LAPLLRPRSEPLTASLALKPLRLSRWRPTVLLAVQSLNLLLNLQLLLRLTPQRL